MKLPVNTLVPLFFSWFWNRKCNPKWTFIPGKLSDFKYQCCCLLILFRWVSYPELSLTAFEIIHEQLGSWNWSSNEWVSEICLTRKQNSDQSRQLIGKGIVNIGETERGGNKGTGLWQVYMWLNSQTAQKRKRNRGATGSCGSSEHWQQMHHSFLVTKFLHVPTWSQ